VAAKTPGVPPDAFYGLFRTGIPPQLGSVLRALDELVIDDTFIGQTLNAVLTQTLDVLRAGLQTALDDNIVPATLAASLDTIVATLGDLRLKYIGSVPYVRGKTPLSTVLATGNVPDELQTKFLNLYAANPKDVDGAIAQLQKDPAVTKQDLATLRFTLGAGELLSGNLPLLQHAVAQRSAGSIKGAGDLARLDVAGWTTVLNQVDPSATSIPPVLPGETPQQRIARLATTLAYRFEKRFPTPALADRLANDSAPPLASSTDVNTFLTNNFSLELRDMHLDRFLRDYPTALNGIGDPAATVNDLKRIQRVFRLFPSYDIVKPLLADGLDSAQSIYLIGEVRFVAKYGESMGKTAATDVYRRSERTYARALTLFANYNGAFNVGPPKALGPAPAPPAAPPPKSASSTSDGSGTPAPPTPAYESTGLEAFPNLQALFG
jgi:hypothetical protein